jgi:hypothetical protein
MFVARVDIKRKVQWKKRERRVLAFFRKRKFASRRAMSQLGIFSRDKIGHRLKSSFYFPSFSTFKPPDIPVSYIVPFHIPHFVVAQPNFLLLFNCSG